MINIILKYNKQYNKFFSLIITIKQECKKKIYILRHHNILSKPVVLTKQLK